MERLQNIKARMHEGGNRRGKPPSMAGTFVVPTSFVLFAIASIVAAPRASAHSSGPVVTLVTSAPDSPLLSGQLVEVHFPRNGLLGPA